MHGYCVSFYFRKINYNAMTNLQQASWSRILRWHIWICHESSRRNSQYPGRNRNKSIEIWTYIWFIFCIPKCPSTENFDLANSFNNFLSSIVLVFVFFDFSLNCEHLLCAAFFAEWGEMTLCFPYEFTTEKDKMENVATFSQYIEGYF